MLHVNIVPRINLERKHHETTSNRRRSTKETTNPATHHSYQEEVMNTPRCRIGLALVILAMCQAFDGLVKPNVPDNDFGAVLYFGIAATFDWLQFYLCRIYVCGSLRRDMEALCIASIVANALGFALYMAPSPPIPFPDPYVWAIEGINYVLAFRLLFMGGGNVIDHRYWRHLVRGAFGRRAHIHPQKAK